MTSSECTLNPIEALRVTAVLEETCEKLLFLENINAPKNHSSSVPPLNHHHHHPSAGGPQKKQLNSTEDETLGQEIAQILADQRTYERTYERLIAQRSVLKGLANKSKFKANEKDIQAISRQLRDSTKSLCRNLVKSSNSVVTAKTTDIIDEDTTLPTTTTTGFQQKGNHPIAHTLLLLFRKTMDELKFTGSGNQSTGSSGEFTVPGKKQPKPTKTLTLTPDSLLTFVHETQAEQAQVFQVMAKEREMVESIKNLGLELEQAKVDHLEEVTEHQRRYVKLKDELLELKSRVNLDIQYARREAQAKTASTLRLYAHEVRAQEQAIAQLSRDVKEEDEVG